MKTFRISVLALALTALAACATDKGDNVECPECDNVTELLVGSRCVPIAEVEPCGPDGHAHGAECHCFSDQAPTSIGGVEYCLQSDCLSEPPAVDPDALACAELDETPEAVTAVTVFADFPNAHVDLSTLAEITLPANQPSYVHFPGLATGHVRVYLDRAGVLAGAFNGSEVALATEAAGANEDCGVELPEVWEVDVVNTSGSPEPQVLAFAAGTVPSVRLVVIKE